MYWETGLRRRGRVGKIQGGRLPGGQVHDKTNYAVQKKCVTKFRKEGQVRIAP